MPGRAPGLTIMTAPKTRRPSKWDRPILDALADGDKTTPQIMALLAGPNRITIERTLASLHDREQAHIATYLRGEDGPPKPVWTLGPGTHAKRPKPYTRAENAKRTRDRLRERDPIEYKARTARYNLRAKGHAVRADPAASWMMRPLETETA